MKIQNVKAKKNHVSRKLSVTFLDKSCCLCLVPKKIVLHLDWEKRAFQKKNSECVTKSAKKNIKKTKTQSNHTGTKCVFVATVFSLRPLAASKKSNSTSKTASTLNWSRGTKTIFSFLRSSWSLKISRNWKTTKMTKVL